MDQPLPLKLSSMSLISQLKLKNILSQCGDKKDLIIDPKLIKPLERICGVSWLRQNGIDKIYKIKHELGATANISRVYFIPACANMYTSVLNHISSVLKTNPSLADLKCFHIIIVPKVLGYFESLLESRGLIDIVKLYTFAWELMVLDDQLLSLELPFLFKELFVDQNQSLLSSISTSLWSLFHVTGRPKAIFSLGKRSASVLDILEVYNETYSRDFIPIESSEEIGAVLIIDRDEDYVSSLLTPSTYSGLLGELFEMTCGYVAITERNTKLKKGKLSYLRNDRDDKGKSTTTTVMALDSSTDSLYGEIKHRHFSEVLSVLSSKAKLLKNEEIKALGIEEMKHFVATKLSQVALFKHNLVNHVVACETIIEEMKHVFEKLKYTETEMLNNRNKNSNFQYVDENFGTEIHIFNSLRLMCLLHLTQGLSRGEYGALVRKYLLAYGFQLLYVFGNLINAGLLVQPTNASSKLLNMPNLGNLSDRLPKWQNKFQSTASKLKQLPSEPDSAKKSSPSYVFSGGYIPLIAAISEVLLTAQSLDEVLTKLPVELKVGGTILEKFKDGMETLNEKLSATKLQDTDLEYGYKDASFVKNRLKKDSKLDSTFPLKTKSLLVYVIGGVTYPEIAACDVIQTATGSKIYIASDCVVSGCDMIRVCVGEV